MESGFSSLKITRQFIDPLTETGITEPTEIQRKAIVPALSGQDILGVAQTGSGKTLAYLLPVVMRLKFAEGLHPRAMILAPSKELVVQIHRVLQLLTKNTDLRSAALYGGVGKKAQIAELETGCDILVSTPGRILDLYGLGHVYLRSLSILVLDEADRMMEMGFMPQLRNILEIIPVKRQNLLFSATFPERVEVLAAEFLEFPTRIEGHQKEKPVKELSQEWIAAPNFRSKLNLLVNLLEDEEWKRVMVFCRTKDAAERVFKYLDRRRADEVRVLHANKGQHTRINALDDFREGEVRVLVTTDVTSRGIDVTGVSHVVNFELPRNPEDYLHRIGRTARIQKEGRAVNFVAEVEMEYLKEIETFIEAKITETPWPEGLAYGEDLPGERMERLREKDRIRRKKDPNFKGAFHQKKRKEPRKGSSGKRRG